MRVIGVDVVAVSMTELAAIGVERCEGIELMHEVLAEADVVSLHLPLNKGTRHLLDSGAFRAMKAGTIVVNVARGRSSMRWLWSMRCEPAILAAPDWMCSRWSHCHWIVRSLVCPMWSLPPLGGRHACHNGKTRPDHHE